MVVTYITPPGIHANRTINAGIREGTIPGWDYMIPVKDAHALIVKGIESDREARVEHPVPDPMPDPMPDPWEVSSGDEDFIYNSAPFSSLVIGKTYLFVFKERAMHSASWMDYAQSKYMVSASKFDGASAYMVASVSDHGNGWAAVANNTTELFASDGWRAFERI